VTEGNAYVYRTKDGKAFFSVLNSAMIGAKCSDGMSDVEYGYHLTAYANGHVYYGCCNPANK
jgi:uncharacterized membrane protein